jgi:uncharacterized protein (TIGR03435 family)
MNCRLVQISTLAIGSGMIVWAQSRLEPAFEVASMRRSTANSSRYVIRYKAGRPTFTNVPLQWIIARAYSVQDIRVMGPRWLEVERYDIEATCPADTSRERLNRMLEHLLIERLGLAAHRETKDIPAYVLTAAKRGPKLQSAEGPPQGGYQMKTEGENLEIRSRTTLAVFAGFLSGFLRLPVVDQTGVTGTFDITLDWALDPHEQSNVDAQVGQELAIQEGLANQLGLKLELKKVPLEVVIVDHVEKVPTEN